MVKGTKKKRLLIAACLAGGGLLTLSAMALIVAYKHDPAGLEQILGHLGLPEQAIDSRPDGPPTVRTTTDRTSTDRATTGRATDTITARGRKDTIAGQKKPLGKDDSGVRVDTPADGTASNREDGGQTTDPVAAGDTGPYPSSRAHRYSTAQAAQEPPPYSQALSAVQRKNIQQIAENVLQAQRQGRNEALQQHDRRYLDAAEALLTNLDATLAEHRLQVSLQVAGETEDNASPPASGATSPNDQTIEQTAQAMDDLADDYATSYAAVPGTDPTDEQVRHNQDALEQLGDTLRTIAELPPSEQSATLKALINDYGQPAIQTTETPVSQPTLSTLTRHR